MFRTASPFSQEQINTEDFGLQILVQGREKYNFSSLFGKEWG